LIVADPIDDCNAALNDVTAEAIGLLINASRTTKLERGTARTRLYEILLKTKYSDLLASAPSWSRASLDALAFLTRPEACPARVTDAIEGEVIRAIVAKESRSLHLWRLLQLVTEFPHIARFVPEENLQWAVARDDGGATLCTSLIMSLRERDRQDIVDLKSTVAALGDEIAVLSDSREAASTLQASLTAEIESLRLRIAELSTRSDSVFEAQIRQGRLDVVNAYIALFEELRGLSSTGVEAATLIEGLLNDMTRTLIRFGIESVGITGEIRKFDPTLDEPTDPESEFVEVLAPAYRAMGGEGIVLRRALVRPAARSGEDCGW
jgi:hypothetical protein